MEICRSGDNGNEDVYSNYFPTILELVSSTFQKDMLVEQGLTAMLTVTNPISRGTVWGSNSRVTWPVRLAALKTRI